MATATKLVIVWEDSTGRRAPTTHYFEGTNTFNQVKEVAKDVIQKEENITDCLFSSAQVLFPIEFGFFGGLTLKNSANECDVENKGKFIFETNQGDTRIISVPGIKNSVVDDDTNLIDVTAGDAQTYVNDVLTNGWFDGATQINETDQNGNALRRLTAAYQEFRKSRKRRSAVRLKS
jgi:hypothetical protein